MGDRVYASIDIGGHLESIEQAEGLIGVMISDRIIHDMEDGQAALRCTLENNTVFNGDSEEVNYGNFDEVDVFIGRHPRLWSSTAYGSGGELSEGIMTLITVGDEFQRFDCRTSGGDPVVPLAEIETLVHQHRLGDCVGAIDELIAKTRRAAGTDLPPLTADPAVWAWLKIFAPQVA